MSNTIILQSEDVLVIEQETASVVETQVETVLTVEATEYGVVETEVETVLVVESETSILVETEVETVLVVQDTEIVVLEAVEQGPPGPPGPIAAIIPGVTDYAWTGEQLDRIDLPDGTYKLYTYALGKILRLDHVKTGQTVRKDYVWVGDLLESTVTTIL